MVLYKTTISMFEPSDTLTENHQGTKLEAANTSLRLFSGNN